MVPLLGIRTWLPSAARLLYGGSSPLLAQAGRYAWRQYSYATESVLSGESHGSSFVCHMRRACQILVLRRERIWLHTAQAGSGEPGEYAVRQYMVTCVMACCYGMAAAVMQARRPNQASVVVGEAVVNHVMLLSQRGHGVSLFNPCICCRR